MSEDWLYCGTRHRRDGDVSRVSDRRGMSEAPLLAASAADGESPPPALSCTPAASQSPVDLIVFSLCRATQYAGRAVDRPCPDDIVRRSPPPLSLSLSLSLSVPPLLLTHSFTRRSSRSSRSLVRIFRRFIWSANCGRIIHGQWWGLRRELSAVSA